MYATEVRCCVHLIIPDGVRFDSRLHEALLSMEPPTTGAPLQKFLCAVQWFKQ